MKKLAKIMIIGLLVMSLTACGGKKAPVNQQAAELEKSIKKDGLTEENMQKLMELADAVAENESSQTTVTPPASAPTPNVEATTSTPEPAEPAETTNQPQDPNSQQEPSLENYDPQIALALAANDLSDSTFFFNQNGHLYILGNLVKKFPDVEYYIGKPYPGECIQLYNDYVVDGENKGIIAYGDIPAFTYLGEGGVMAYSENSIPALELRKVEFAGYTLGISVNEYGYTTICVPEIQELLVDNQNNVENLVVKDLSGNVIDDIHNLKSHEIYTIAWSQGTQSYEYYAAATSRLYTYTSKFIAGQPEYSLEGEPAPNGLAKYDLSSLPAGMYALNPPFSSGIIEIP